MKTESQISPHQVTVESNGDIILCENITLIDRDGLGVYQYDSYRINVPYRPNLKDQIEENFAEWLAYAKAEEAKPSAEQIAQADQTLKVVDILMEVGLL